MYRRHAVRDIEDARRIATAMIRGTRQQIDFGLAGYGVARFTHKPGFDRLTGMLNEQPALAVASPPVTSACRKRRPGCSAATSATKPRRARPPRRLGRPPKLRRLAVAAYVVYRLRVRARRARSTGRTAWRNRICPAARCERPKP
jgi:hypothetical protein